MAMADMRVCARCCDERGLLLQVYAGGALTGSYIPVLFADVIADKIFRRWSFKGSYRRMSTLWKADRIWKVCATDAADALSWGHSVVDAECPYLMQHLAAESK